MRKKVINHFQCVIHHQNHGGNFYKLEKQIQDWVGCSLWCNPGILHTASFFVIFITILIKLPLLSLQIFTPSKDWAQSTTNQSPQNSMAIPSLYFLSINYHLDLFSCKTASNAIIQLNWTIQYIHISPTPATVLSWPALIPSTSVGINSQKFNGKFILQGRDTNATALLCSTWSSRFGIHLHTHLPKGWHYLATPKWEPNHPWSIAKEHFMFPISWPCTQISQQACPILNPSIVDPLWFWVHAGWQGGGPSHRGSKTRGGSWCIHPYVALSIEGGLFGLAGQHAGKMMWGKWVLIGVGWAVGWWGLWPQAKISNGIKFLCKKCHVNTLMHPPLESPRPVSFHDQSPTLLFLLQYIGQGLWIKCRREWGLMIPASNSLQGPVCAQTPRALISASFLVQKTLMLAGTDLH